MNKQIILTTKLTPLKFVTLTDLLRLAYRLKQRNRNDFISCSLINVYNNIIMFHRNNIILNIKARELNQHYFPQVGEKSIIHSDVMYYLHLAFKYITDANEISINFYRLNTHNPLCVYGGINVE